MSNVYQQQTKMWLNKYQSTITLDMEIASIRHNKNAAG